MKTYSQPCTRQDEWVVDRLRPNWGGFYVEIGAHNGVRHSNTKMLEDDFGWRGILVEPNPILFQELCLNRPHNQLFDVAISDENGQDWFLLGDSFGGLGHFMPRDWLEEHRMRRTEGCNVQTKTLSWLLREANAPNRIDYLSLDVEGAELRILEQFYAGYYHLKYQFNLITVEFRYDAILLNQLEELLDEQYVLEKVEAFDAFFVNRDL